MRSKSWMVVFCLLSCWGSVASALNYDETIALFQKGDYAGFKLHADVLLAQPDLAKNIRESLQMNLARALYEQGHWDEARAGFQKFATDFPDSKMLSGAQYLATISLFFGGDYAAFKTEAEALLAQPDTPGNVRESLQMNLARSLDQRGRWDEARAAYQKFASDFPQSEIINDAQYHAALSKFYSGDYTTFKTEAEALLAKPGMPVNLCESLRFQIAMISFLHGDYLKAIDSMKEIASQTTDTLTFFSNDLLQGRAALSLADDLKNQGKAKESESYLQQGTDHLHELQQKIQDAIEKESSPDRARTMRLMRVESYSFLQDWAGVKREAKLLSDIYTSPSVGWAHAKVWEGIACFSMDPQDLEGAAKALDAVLNAKVEDANHMEHIPTRAAQWRAAVAQRQENTTATLALARKIRDEMPEGPIREGALVQFSDVLKDDAPKQ